MIVAGRYSFGNLLTLRGGYSTGFRAPTPGQMNYTGVTTSFDGVTGMQVNEGTLKPTDPLCVALGYINLVIFRNFTSISKTQKQIK